MLWPSSCAEVSVSSLDGRAALAVAGLGQPGSSHDVAALRPQARRRHRGENDPQEPREHHLLVTNYA